jgi:hypothetical protein
MNDDLRIAFEHQTAAMRELRGLLAACEASLADMNIVFERQGLKDWPAGHAVNKDFCELSHSTLEKEVCNKGTKFEQALTARLKWSWVVGAFILSGYGLVILFILGEIS